MSRLPSIARPARLTSNLLVRKGEARPAGSPARQTPATSPFPLNGSASRHADLGHALESANDAGPRDDTREPEAAPSSGRAASVPLATAIPARPGRSGGGSEERFATTIRLDAVRHYRLKLFAARQRTEVPDLIMKALDAYLDANGGDCPCLRGETSACSC